LQIRRSAISVASNIAEGYGRSPCDYVRFLHVTSGSLKELETRILLTVRPGMLAANDLEVTLNLCSQTASMLTTLIHRLKQ